MITEAAGGAKSAPPSAESAPRSSFLLLAAFALALGIGLLFVFLDQREGGGEGARAMSGSVSRVAPRAERAKIGVTMEGAERARGRFVVCLLVGAGFGVFGACSSGDDSSTGTTPTGPVLSGSPDTGSFAFPGDGGNDADDLSCDGGTPGDLLAACDPANPSSCPAGFTCYGQHTSATWWVDLYGTCTFDCTSLTYALCDCLDGVCGCPVPQGSTTASCSVRRRRFPRLRPCVETGDPARRERRGWRVRNAWLLRGTPARRRHPSDG